MLSHATIEGGRWQRDIPIGHGGWVRGDVAEGWRTVDGQSLVTVAEAARRLERSTEQVRRYLREERLSGRRIGGQWFIDGVALETFSQVLREERGFLDKVKPATEVDPLATVIGIGRGGGSNIAEGKDAYRRAFWWRR